MILGVGNTFAALKLNVELAQTVLSTQNAYFLNKFRFSFDFSVLACCSPECAYHECP
jgi:hypothetical protein